MRILPCGLEVIDVDHLVRLDVDVHLVRGLVDSGESVFGRGESAHTTHHHADTATGLASANVQVPAPLGAVELVGGRVVAASVLPAGTRVQAGHERVRVELRQREVESEVKTCGL